MLVYLSKGEYPPLAEGDWLLVRGRTSHYHIERRTLVPRPEDLQRTGAGTPLRPRFIRGGQVNEAHEGLLVQIIAPAVGYSGRYFYLDNGSGEAWIYVWESSGRRSAW